MELGNPAFMRVSGLLRCGLSTKTENNRGAGKPTPLKNMPLSHVGHQGTFNYIVC